VVGLQSGYKLAEHEEEEEETGSGGFALPVRTFWNVFGEEDNEE
jgi:hypothetical protein